MENSIEMIKKIFLYVFTTFLSTCLLLLLLEGAFCFLGFPQGASDFIERAIFQQKLEFRKPAGQFRIFVFGESTVHGAGYAPTSSPVKWLDAYLKDFLPGRNIRVINFGRLGEGSADIAQAFIDTLQYQPDLAIFYLGHNAFFLVNRADVTEKKEAKFASRLKKWFHKSRLISAVVRESIKQKIKRHDKETQDVMGDPRVETIPEPFKQGSPKITLPGSPLFLENIRFFKANIEKIIEAGKKNKVPVLFMKPVCNLKDYPPNLSSHLKALSAEELKQWEHLYQQGQEAATKKDDLQALDYFEKAFAIDPTYADLSFRLGQLYFQNGALGKARSFFVQARDNDVVIGRAPKGILTIFDDLAKQGKIHYFDTEKVFASKVPGGILGWPIIEDNVHFSIEGHALAGRALAEEIARNVWIEPRSAWRFDRERPMAEIKKEFGVSDETILVNYCSIIGFLANRPDMRLEFAQRAWDLFPEHPLAQRELAWSYWLQGDKDRAIDIYRHLRKTDPIALEAVFRTQPEIKQAFESSVAILKTPVPLPEKKGT